MAATLGLSLACGSGCGGTTESVVLLGSEKVEATTIDRDPMALLPSGPLLVGYLDTATLAHTNLGTEVMQLARNLVPLGTESNFVPSRDIRALYAGVYAMQGADLCAVAQGSFDVDAIARAADARSLTTSGVPLVKTKYAGSDIYTVGNIGFVVLTNHTILSGNETGMRRALDRLRTTKLEPGATGSPVLARSLPGWMTELTTREGAAFTMAGDFSSFTPALAVVREVPFLAGLRYMRVIGNFRSPGLNFAGALTYADAANAQNGATSLRNVQSLGQLMGLLYSLGFGSSLPPMQIVQKESDVAFTLPLDDRMAYALVHLAVAATSPLTAKPGAGGR